MEITLNDKQKKELLVFLKYIKSYGSDTAYTNLHYYGGSVDYYDNEIRSGLGKIIKTYPSIVKVVGELIDQIDLDDVEFESENDSNRVEIEFFSSEKKIMITVYETVYDTEPASTSGSILELENDDLNDLKEKGVTLVEITYSGGGDSGYIDDEMSVDGNSIKVPAGIENVCYNILEEYGGWENNEGSQGKITFDFVSDDYSVYHEWNTEREQVAHEETITL
jgi:hypothetical protein